ncbi:MAG: hypothetical protein L6N96_05715, partial [Candidatus Methylarchaceae archaeon HK02M2]|nr:hypothetical protein [Candidatus Methylarchaceae archaeon HK02M2]
VENAIEAHNLIIVAAQLLKGPELKGGIVEATPERVVLRTTECPTWELYNEFEVDSEHRACDPACQIWTEEGITAVNTKIALKLTKARPRGDLYCEFVFEFKDE